MSGQLETSAMGHDTAPGQPVDRGPVDPAGLRRHRFVALDSLRGIAAVGVMFFHFGDVGLISSQPLLRMGYIFVDFFFVLSGFIIAAAYGDLLARGFSRVTFMMLRLGRIYPLHIAVVAGFALAKIGTGHSLFEGSHGVEYLARAVFLLDGYFPNDLNYYNAASWSISIELAAYGLAALLFGRGVWGLAVAGLIWIAAVWGYLAEIDLPVFGAMLQVGLMGFGLGVAAWALFSRLDPQKRLPWGSALEIAVLITAGLLISYVGDVTWRLLVCDLSFVAAVILFAREEGAISRILAAPSMQALGRWSYSIYLTHLLILATAGYGLNAAVTKMGRTDLLRPSGVAGLEKIDFGLWGDTALTLIIAATVIAVSAGTYRMIEEPGRQWARTAARRRGAGRAEIAAPTM